MNDLLGIAKFAGWALWNYLIWSVIPCIGIIGWAHIGTGSPEWGWPMLIFSIVNILAYIWVNHGWRFMQAWRRHEMKDPDKREAHVLSLMTPEQIAAVRNFDPVTGEPRPTATFVHESVPELRNGHKYYRMGQPNYVWRFGKLVYNEYPLA